VGDGDEVGSEVGKRKRGGKGKGKEERVWTDREYIKRGTLRDVPRVVAEGVYESVGPRAYS
jgi:hypothetical protein